ncbi:MAG: DUF721 domain-containing protein [Elusimicrobiota bacterium]|nr:DUF721 domain-containing protein [Elusimicrobiota bacterium]
MRKGEVRHIGAIVDKFLSGCSITADDYALRVFFSEFIGHKLSKYAELVKFSKDTVFISVKSAVVKNEITLMRRKIIKALNEFFGSDKIKNLKIVED